MTEPAPALHALNEPAAPVRIARFWPLFSAALALLLVGGLAAVIVYRENNKPFGLELEWMSELVEHRSPFLTSVALVFNALGGGLLAAFVVPILIIAALLLWRRPWAALYFTVATIVATALVQILKKSIGRPRPTDILVAPDFGSFPSGHSANAAVMAATLAIILWRTWIWAAGALYTVAMMLSRTYLGAHWISDTIGGLLVGVGVAVIVWGPLALKIHLERHSPHPPPWVWLRRPHATPAP